MTASATENIPPALQVRVKRCGKSAPLFWWQNRQGKPQGLKDQIYLRYQSYTLEQGGWV